MTGACSPVRDTACDTVAIGTRHTFQRNVRTRGWPPRRNVRDALISSLRRSEGHLPMVRCAASPECEDAPTVLVMKFEGHTVIPQPLCCCSSSGAVGSLRLLGEKS
jgi:hypothetical protein